MPGDSVVQFVKQKVFWLIGAIQNLRRPLRPEQNSFPFTTFLIKSFQCPPVLERLDKYFDSRPDLQPLDDFGATAFDRALLASILMRPGEVISVKHKGEEYALSYFIRRKMLEVVIDVSGTVFHVSINSAIGDHVRKG